MRTAPFLGKGIAFPFRLNTTTGGVQTTEGLYDGSSVTLEFLDDRSTIREDTGTVQNHIAESVSNILLTRQGEDDTLPEFGSMTQSLVFERHTQQFKLASQTYFTFATRRWEKRATIDEVSGVKWKDTWQDVSQNTLPLQLNLDLVVQQQQKNLVSPFVTPRQAVEQEYPSGGRDEVGYDSLSRYYPSNKATSSRGKFTYFKKVSLPKPYPDDIFYEVTELDTWRSISSKVYQGEQRYWWLVATAAQETAARENRGINAINTLEGPITGDILRLPSRERVLMR